MEVALGRSHEHALHFGVPESDDIPNVLSTPQLAADVRFTLTFSQSVHLSSSVLFQPAAQSVGGTDFVASEKSLASGDCPVTQASYSERRVRCVAIPREFLMSLPPILKTKEKNLGDIPT